MTVPCAAISAELLEAEMFGIDGATRMEKRPGNIRLAEGGTLFLDEIDEMEAPLQARLLRALQYPVGGQARDVRIIAATISDLPRRMEEAVFRRDLFYRLAGFVLEVPPLRHCEDDVAALVRHFLEIFSNETGTRTGGVTARALRCLASYPWPGNVRQLEHEMRRLVYLAADGQEIGSGMLSPEIVRTLGPEPPARRRSDRAGTVSLRLQDHVEQVERWAILRALERADGRQRRAARLLGIARSTLARKLRALGIPT